MGFRISVIKSCCPWLDAVLICVILVAASPTFYYSVIKRPALTITLDASKWQCTAIREIPTDDELNKKAYCDTWKRVVR